MSPNLFEHTKETWNHALQGQSSTAEKFEIGAEIIVGTAAVAALARFGLARFSTGAIARTEANLPALKILDSGEKLTPALTNKAALAEESWQHLIFSRTQEIQQRPGETSAALHERLRPLVVNGFRAIEHPTRIDTPSWYTFDASKTLGIDNAVAVMTSTCKHETPSMTFVGIRKPGEWMSELPSGGIGKPFERKSFLNDSVFESRYRYKLHPLGRELTSQEKNAIYDKM